MNHEELVEVVARAICEARNIAWRNNTGRTIRAIERFDFDTLNNHWRHMARHALATAEPLIRADERKRVVNWLRKEAILCDCHAHNETECACGAWYDNKRVDISTIIEAIEAGDYRKGEA